MSAVPLAAPGLQDWMARGLCRQIDPDLWHPEKGKSGDAAKQFCRVCHVLAECDEYALARPELAGVWGGRSERDRRNQRRTLRDASTAREDDHA